MRSSCIVRICSMFSFLDSWLFTVHCSPSGFQGPLLCAYINLWLTSATGIQWSWMQRGIAEIYDSNGLFPWYLKAKIQKVLFGPEPPKRFLGGAMERRTKVFAIWSNYRFMRIYLKTWTLSLVYWCIEHHCLRIFFEQCEINVKHASRICIFYSWVSELDYVGFHGIPHVQPHLTKVHHFGGHVIVPRREGSKHIQAQLVDRGLHWVWFILFKMVQTEFQDHS